MASMEGLAVECVVFDLDGTLCDTVDVDDECYRLAVASTLGIHGEAVDWGDAPHRTDSGIARWLWSTHRGSQPTTDDIERIRRRFFELLEVERTESPDRFASIAGAAAFLESCVAAGLRVAIGLREMGAGLVVENYIGKDVRSWFDACFVRH